MFTIECLFLPPLGGIATLAHAFGIMRLVSMFTFRDQSLFVLYFPHDLRLKFGFDLTILLECSPLEVVDDCTLINFEIEEWSLWVHL